MSDKMLMEDWRKFLVEYKELPGGGAGRSWSETFGEELLAWFRTDEQEIEAASDRLIKKLPQISDFWNEIFSVFNKETKKEPMARFKSGDFLSPSKEKQDIQPTVDQIIEKYTNPEDPVLEGAPSEWKRYVSFVLICMESNLDKDWKEVLNNVTEFMGEGQSWASQALRYSLAVGGVLGALTATVGATTVTLPAVLLGGVAAALGLGGPLAKVINDYTEENDAKRIDQELKKADIDSLGSSERENRATKELEFSADKGRELIRTFHETEYSILNSLVNNPHKLPSDVALQESKFHDNWREFLLTEEKLWNS